MMPSQPDPAFNPSSAAAFAHFPEMERLMGAFIAPRARQVGAAYPPMNVWEDEQALYMESELPGYTLENLEITTLGGQLTIAGTRPAQGAEGGYIRRERVGEPTKFSRTLKVWVPFEADQVRADLKHGVLTIIVPKATAAQARKIDVKAA